MGLHNGIYLDDHIWFKDNPHRTMRFRQALPMDREFYAQNRPGPYDQDMERALEFTHAVVCRWDLTRRCLITVEEEWLANRYRNDEWFQENAWHRQFVLHDLTG